MENNGSTILRAARPVILTIMFFSLNLSAQTPDSSAANDSLLPPALTGITRVEYDLPFYDAPFTGLGGYAFPSMSQSLAVTKDISMGIHWALARYGAAARDRGSAQLIQTVGFALSEIALISLPGGYSWLHEEWHRAVLKNRGINSYNGVYDFRILSSVIPVSHVTDTELIVLKRDQPADMVRLSEAGNEAQIELVRSLRKELFFNRQECSLDWTTLFINTFSPASYVFLCSMPYADQLTDEMEKAEGKDVSKRDIVGMDFTAWVYDLFRPDMPYAARGIDSSRGGIKRYIKHSYLTNDEKDYLQLQGILAWLNLANPQLIMKNRFKGTNLFTRSPFFWNAALVHELTPFGFAIDCDAMATNGKMNLTATLHSFFSRHGYHPGAAVEADDIPLSIAGRPLYLSGKIDGWFQPARQRFDDRSAKAGGSLSAGLKTAVTRHLLLSVSAAGKTAGWEAGALSLERQFSIQFGLSVWLPNRLQL